MSSKMHRPLDCVTIEFGKQLPSSLMGLTPVRTNAAEINAKRLEDLRALGRTKVVVTNWGDGTPVFHTGASFTELRGKTVLLGRIIKLAADKGLVPNCRLIENKTEHNWKLQLWFTPAREGTEYVDGSLFLKEIVSGPWEDHPVLGVFLNPDTTNSERNWVNLVVGARSVDDANEADSDEMVISYNDDWDQLAFITYYRPKPKSFGTQKRIGAAETTVQNQRDAEAERHSKEPRRYHGPKGLVERAKEQSE